MEKKLKSLKKRQWRNRGQNFLIWISWSSFLVTRGIQQWNSLAGKAVIFSTLKGFTQWLGNHWSGTWRPLAPAPGSPYGQMDQRRAFYPSAGISLLRGGSAVAQTPPSWLVLLLPILFRLCFPAPSDGGLIWLLVLISLQDVIFQKSLRHIFPTWSLTQSPDLFLKPGTTSLGEEFEILLSKFQ